MARRTGPQIAGFDELYQRTVGDRPFLGTFLAGHLVVEFLLRCLVQQYDPRLAQHADTLRHHALITLNHQIGTISDPQREVLIAINTLRNRLAHELTYEPTIEELRTLWTQATRAFSDLSDGIDQGAEVLGTLKPGEEIPAWIFSELFVQISYDLHEEYIRRGGDMESF